MSQHNPLPHEDQQVTLISVNDGHISVTSARALVVKPHKVALRIGTTVSESPDWAPEQPLTMIYTHGDRVMRLRGVIRDRIADDRVTVEPVGEVKEGDRRDFRRADVKAKVYVRAATSRNAAEARSEQLAHSVAASSPEFISQVVNISGSGLSFNGPVLFEEGSLIDLRLVLERPVSTLVTMIGHIVRASPIDGGYRFAVRFAELSESDQDLIVYTVFSNHFAAEGLSEALEE